MRAPIIAPMYEYLSIIDCDRLVRVDCDQLVVDDANAVRAKERFCFSNRWGYYLCANAWIGLTSDLGSDTLGYLLRSLIRDSGLVSAIRFCAESADMLVRGLHKAPVMRTDDPFPLLPDESQTALQKELLFRISKLPHKVARQILVFPKRFAPVVPAKNSVLHSRAIEQFRETNKSNVAVERRINSLMARVVTPPPRSLPFRDEEPEPEMVGVAKLARTFCGLLVGDFEGLSSQQFPRVGPGACRNAGPALLERLESIAKYGEYEMSHAPTWRAITGFYHVPHPDLRDRHYYRRDSSGKRKQITRGPRLPRGYWGKSPIPQVCRVSSVPKSYKATRLIALEDVCNMSRQLYLKDALMHRIGQSPFSMLLPLRDQEQNRQLAQRAAESDLLVTLDQSHASDSVVKPLVRLLYPHTWYLAFERCVPFGFITDEVDERPQPLHMFATMGCGCTFAVEATVFVSLTVASILYQMGVRPDITPEELRRLLLGPLSYLLELIRVMGDDIIAPAEYELAINRALTYCGFVVNDDKSFSHGRFRESCGADWLRCDDEVENLTCIYWPRIPIGTDGQEPQLGRTYSEWNATTQERYVTTGLQRIIALQHRLYGISPRASDFLLSLVQVYYPELSTSFPGESDILPWSADSSLQYLWEIPTIRDVSLFSPNHLRDTVLETQLVPFATAEAYFVEEYRRGKLRAHFGNAAERTRVRLAMDAAKRRVLTVPTLVVDEQVTGINPSVAEVFAYELSMQNLTATADQILPLAISGPEERYCSRMRQLALNCFRPARLSSARLLARSYRLGMTTIAE